MDNTQILKISEKYATTLRGMGAKPQSCDTSLNVKPGDPCIYDHCLFMCEMIQKFALEEPEKALRWVCFLQGVLWNSGLSSIDSMREDNRLALKKST